MGWQEIEEKFNVKKVESVDGIPTYYAPLSQIHDIGKFLKQYCEILLDITAVDYLGKKEKRFEMVYHFLSLKEKVRIRVKVEVGEDEEVPTFCDLWNNANWLEREVYDMFGIKFRGHPDLRRILLYPEFKGHPLRKDYPLKKSQPRIELLRKERER